MRLINRPIRYISYISKNWLLRGGRDTYRDRPIRKIFMTFIMFIAMGFLLGFLCIYHYQVRFPGRTLRSLREHSKIFIEGKQIKSENCKCNSSVKIGARSWEVVSRIPYNTTFCSKRAYARGPNQNVVSYVLYRANEFKLNYFFIGIQENIDLVKKFYPGWFMRLYIDLKNYDQKTIDAICKMECDNEFFDICKIKDLPSKPQGFNIDEVNVSDNMFPAIWRYLPTLDTQVDVLLSRDLDSIITEREVAAVKEWQYNSTAAIHSMRDHPEHDVHMLAGMWGTNLTRTPVEKTKNSSTASDKNTPDNGKMIRKLWKQSWLDMSKDQEFRAQSKAYGPDQNLLTKHVWNKWGEINAFQHDAYLCMHFKGTIVSLPTQRKMEAMNFVGARRGTPMLKKETPVQCRRNKDWIYG